MLNFLIKRMRNNRGQSTGELALLMGLVIAGAIATQTYVQRALQARVRDASQYMTNNGNAGEGSDEATIGSTAQYEPYYLNSQYNIDKSSSETTKLGAGLSAKSESSNRVRKLGGAQTSTYDTTTEGLGSGL